MENSNKSTLSLDLDELRVPVSEETLDEFMKVVASYRTRLLSFLEIKIFNPKTRRNDAEDILQDSLIAVVKIVKKGKNIDNFLAYLVTIYKRVCININRKRKNQREVPLSLVHLGEDREHKTCTDPNNLGDCISYKDEVEDPRLSKIELKEELVLWGNFLIAINKFRKNNLSRKQDKLFSTLINIDFKYGKMQFSMKEIANLFRLREKFRKLFLPKWLKENERIPKSIQQFFINMGITP